MCSLGRFRLRTEGIALDILISEWIDPRGIDILGQAGRVHYEPDLWRDSPRLLAWAERIDALIVRNQTRVTAELLQMGHLRVVGRLGVGLDNIDVAAAKAHHIPVVVAMGANGVAVAEYVLTCCLLHSRQLAAVDADTRAGHWNRRLGGMELYGKTLGIMGLGDIGQRLAYRARTLGMRVVAYDPVRLPTHWAVMDLDVTRVALEEILAQSDFLSLHIPLTSETRHFLNALRLQQMKPPAMGNTAPLKAAAGSVVGYP